MYKITLAVILWTTLVAEAYPKTTTAHAAFLTDLPVSLSDSYQILNIAVPLPMKFSVEIDSLLNFTHTLQKLEETVWSKTGHFCNQPEISAMLRGNQQELVKTIMVEHERAENLRLQLIDEVEDFVNRSAIHHRERRSPLLFALGAATAITIEPLIEKAGCKLLSIFGLCHDSKSKLENLHTQLHNLETTVVDLDSEHKSFVHVVASSSQKLHEDTQRVLNYTDENLGRLDNHLRNLEEILKDVKTAQACDHKRTDMFMYVFKTQNAVNNVSWALNSLHAELQAFRSYLDKEKSVLAAAMGALANGILPPSLVPPSTLRKMISNTEIQDKRTSIPDEHLGLYYSLPLVRNVFVNRHGILVKLKLPLYSGHPIFNSYKAVAIPQPILNTTTALQLKLKRTILLTSTKEEMYSELNMDEFSSCQGSSLFKLCPKPFVMETEQTELCLTALLYHHESAALRTCHREIIDLPSSPAATYLSNSAYLLTATDDAQPLYNITFKNGKKLLRGFLDVKVVLYTHLVMDWLNIPQTDCCFFRMPTIVSRRAASCKQ